MDPGQDPDGFFFILDECREQLEDMGESVHDERYEDIILQGLPIEYARVRQTSHEKRDFGLDDIRHMVYSIIRQPFASVQIQSDRRPRRRY